MLISSAMRSRTFAVGVGFLLNSISRVDSWSCVARWRFWFFCCCVKVLFLGGRFDEVLCEVDVAEEGVSRFPGWSLEMGVAILDGESIVSGPAAVGATRPVSSRCVAISGDV